LWQTNDRFQQALLKDAVNIFFPGRYDHNAALVSEALLNSERRLSRELQTAYLTERLNGDKLAQLAGMYAKFLFVYILVMLLTYYGVQTLGRGCLSAGEGRRCSPAGPPGLRGRQREPAVLWLPWSFLAGICHRLLDAHGPHTDTVFFMTILGVISNGLLIVYATKFQAFLEAESRKGYVETAMVKNLHDSYGRATAASACAQSCGPPSASAATYSIISTETPASSIFRQSRSSGVSDYRAYHHRDGAQYPRPSLLRDAAADAV